MRTSIGTHLALWAVVGVCGCEQASSDAGATLERAALEPGLQAQPAAGAALGALHAALIPVAAQAELGTASWTLVDTLGAPVPREEAAFAALGGKGYLLGGRGIRTTGVFDPALVSWNAGAAPPLELHHFQAVALGGSIYAIGAMTGGYPNESPVGDIYTYDPATDRWATAGQIPVARRRGAAGLVFHEGYFYLVGGIINGHVGGYVPWLDRYDPASGEWTVLADAPRPRDHFQAAVVGGKLYAAGGRTTSFGTGEVFTLTIPEVDVYDFASGTWSTLGASSNLPTERAGGSSVALGDWLLVIGGESAARAAHDEVEALYTPSGEWLRLPDLVRGRHGTGVIQLGGALITSAGSGNQGGGPLLTTTERWAISATGEPRDAGSEPPGAGTEPEALEPSSAEAPSAEAPSASLPLGVAPEARELGAGVSLAEPVRAPAEALADVPVPPPIEPAFSASNLAGESLQNPTSLQFGPDGRLYVSQQNGLILRYAVQRMGPNAYVITSTEALTQIQEIHNHDDDTGALNSRVTTREVTGLAVVGSAEFPVLLVTSSDPRIGAGGGANDLNLDTNSGVLSRLSWTGSGWEHVELVRGLPRSEENHASNGIAVDVASGVLYLAQGGHTNAGAPSNNFAFTTEYALSAAVLRIDLRAIEALPTRVDAEGTAFKYELPTLDDPTKPNRNGVEDPDAEGYDGVDSSDPFGGNDGFNQAKWALGSPVQVFSGGLRNPYDVVLTSDGRLFTIDNGANQGWGGHPAHEGAYPGPNAGQCTNEYVVGEPGSTLPGPNDPTVNNQNGLHWLRPLAPGERNYPGQSEPYHPGHPNPTRGNPLGAGLYRNGVYLPPGDPALPVDWPPVDPALAHPAECDFRNPGEADNSLTTFSDSTNGIAEYTASNFGGAMRGNLLAAGYNGRIYRIVLAPDGTTTLNCPPNPASCTATIASGFARQPLDVVALGDAAPFPGTVWVANVGSSSITVLEPADYEAALPAPAVPCAEQAALNPLGDEDGDGYTNRDEALNDTSPCSGASRPPDVDGDALSDRLDADDDNDGIPDVGDPFALDASNGLSTPLPVDYEFFSAFPGTGLFGLGFTGLMSNGRDDYLDLFDGDAVIAGGTSGLLTVPSVGAGDAYAALDSQHDAFLYGIDPTSGGAGDGRFTIRGKLNGPFFSGLSPVPSQSQGVFIGTGAQDDYLAFTLSDARGFTLTEELAGRTTQSTYGEGGAALLGATSITLFLTVNPSTGSVQPAYLVEGAERVTLGAPILLSGALLEAVRGQAHIGASPTGLAVGVIATSRGGAPFGATWDSLKVDVGE